MGSKVVLPDLPCELQAIIDGYNERVMASLQVGRGRGCWLFEVFYIEECRAVLSWVRSMLSRWDRGGLLANDSVFHGE
jgi:hypothetical protein